MAETLCKGCKWFSQWPGHAVGDKSDLRDYPPGADLNEIVFIIKGECRRSAPIQNGWPMVRADDWCGNSEIKDI